MIRYIYIVFPCLRYNEKSKSLPGKSRTIDQQLQTIFTPTPIQLQRVTIEKSSAAQDFGFSLSDGMYEKGVYVSAVRIGSPAHSAGLRSFDRILQVNCAVVFSKTWILYIYGLAYVYIKYLII